MSTTYDAVDLFAGPGGWDVAAHSLGLKTIGIEFDKEACNTRRAAGLPTIEGDVRNYGPADFPGVKGFIASPPCQTFSMAGKGSGRAALDVVLACIERMRWRDELPTDAFADERTALVLEPLRWILEAADSGRPYEWVCLEQVPTVLPVWEAVAEVLRLNGYSVVTGNIHAEQYGVPQTRKRAVLVAVRDGVAALPVPTHSKFYSHDPSKLDAGVLKWVSMAEALGWGLVKRPSYTVSAGGTKASHSGHEWGGMQTRELLLSMAEESDPTRWASKDLVGFPRRADTDDVVTIDGIDYRARDLRPAAHPSQTVTEKARSWTRYTGNDRIRVTPEEAAALQTFPEGHPWRGPNSRVFQQIGNAVPPLMAAAVLKCATT